MTAFADYLQDIAGSLGIPHAAEQVLAFVEWTGIAATDRFQAVWSDVAPESLPVEISFSQANSSDLRLLVEPCRAGEGIVARTAMAISALGRTAGAFSPEAAEVAQNLVRSLLPDGEALPHLNWRSTVWLALRADSERTDLRVYVNGQYGTARDRWCRIGRAFTACGLGEWCQALERIRQSVDDLVQPIGLCFDVQPSGVRPARIHTITEKISPFWLLRLLAATGNQEAAEDAADFLDLFDLMPREGACPILISIGFDQGGEGNLKIDVDLPNLGSDRAAGHGMRDLANAEKRFGEIAGYHRVRHTLNGSDPRYIGLTIRPDTRFLNVYFPGARAPVGCGVACPEQALEKGRAFVTTQLSDTGALLMDVRTSGCPRPVPDRWPDLYMTCLLMQEHSPVPLFPASTLDRTRAYVEAAREGWGWRYLPDLPLDLDDTAMAWAALEPAGRALDSSVVARIVSLANPDGGFPTFIGAGGEIQPSHPAVTLNVCYALDRSHAWWPHQPSMRYLERWMHQPDFPACQWMSSPLFPLYLFARADCTLQRLGGVAAKRLASRVEEIRRGDGTWGGALPDSLDTALAVLTLYRLGVAVSGAPGLKRFFLESQFSDGGWGWSPLYSDGSGSWFGHRALTTEFVIRALGMLECEAA